MTDTTQPPAETLAAEREAAAYEPNEAEALAARLDESIAFKVYSSSDDHIRDAAAMLRRLSALTRRAGGDAIPAGDASAEEAAECWLDENVAPGHSRDRDYDAGDMIDAFIAGRESATHKPPAGGDAAAAEERDALLAALGWKTGPFRDALSRKVILDDCAALRPEMVKARQAAQDAQSRAQDYHYMLGEYVHGSRSGVLGRLWEEVKRLRSATPKTPAGGDVGADAADILDHYAQFIRDEVKADDLERHPYLPHIEQVAADLRVALALPAPVVEGDVRERFKAAMVDAARARGGAGAVFIANGHTNIWLDAAYDAFAALSGGRSHG